MSKSQTVTDLPAPDKLTKLQELNVLLPREIRGQSHTLPRIISAIRRGELRITKPSRPRGSFLLLGPTGVGKTETVVVATNHVFGEGKLFRFDMSEFQNQEALGLLLGARLAATHCAASKARCSGWNYHSLLRCQDISGRLFPTVSQWFWRLLQQKPKPLKQTGSREEPWHDSGGSMR